MNVLIFVMTILMLLSMMTYARIEGYRANTVARKQFETYISSTERAIFSDQALKRYKNTVVQKASARKEAAAKSGTSQLSWFALLNEEERKKNPEKAAYVEAVTKNLMLQLFSDFPEFQREYLKDAAVLDHLMHGIVTAVDALPDDKKIKQVSDLLLLELQDPSLDHLFYSMIKSTPAKVSPQKKQPLEPTEDDPDEENFSSDESVSLLNHLTVLPQRTRLFLAKEPLLLAIFNDKTSVKMVQELRDELYRKVRSKEMNAEEASGEFKTKLTGLYPFLTDAVFDFRVSKVNPNNYR